MKPGNRVLLSAEAKLGGGNRLPDGDNHRRLADIGQTEITSAVVSDLRPHNESLSGRCAPTTTTPRPGDAVAFSTLEPERRIELLRQSEAEPVLRDVGRHQRRRHCQYCPGNRRSRVRGKAGMTYPGVEFEDGRSYGGPI